MIPKDFGKKLSEIHNVGVTITPGSPREWTTRAVECYYNAASEQKCAGIKRPSPARRQNIGWSSSPKQLLLLLLLLLLFLPFFSFIIE